MGSRLVTGVGHRLGRYAAQMLGVAGRLSAMPSQVMGQGLGDVPVVPELRFAPRRARPRIPGCAAGSGATDPGPSLWCSFFHRQMSRGPARAGVGDCLHESTPPSRCGRVCRSFFPIGGLQTVARHAEPRLHAGRTKEGSPAGLAIPRTSHHPGIAHPQGGLTPTRRVAAPGSWHPGCGGPAEIALFRMEPGRSITDVRWKIAHCQARL